MQVMLPVQHVSYSNAFSLPKPIRTQHTTRPLPFQWHSTNQSISAWSFVGEVTLREEVFLSMHFSLFRWELKKIRLSSLSNHSLLHGQCHSCSTIHWCLVDLRYVLFPKIICLISSIFSLIQDILHTSFVVPSRSHFSTSFLLTDDTIIAILSRQFETPTRKTSNIKQNQPALCHRPKEKNACWTRRLIVSLFFLDFSEQSKEYWKSIGYVCHWFRHWQSQTSKWEEYANV